MLSPAGSKVIQYRQAGSSSCSCFLDVGKSLLVWAALPEQLPQHVPRKSDCITPVDKVRRISTLVSDIAGTAKLRRQVGRHVARVFAFGKTLGNKV